MEWINIYGVIIMIILMIPNIMYAYKNKDGFNNQWNNKIIELFEQLSRFTVFTLMILIIPNCGFNLDYHLNLYLICNVILLVSYCLIWIFTFKISNVFKALSLSIIPSLMFIISGILSSYYPLIISALIFAICHITISYKNAIYERK